jgi:hypothetical protein
MICKINTIYTNVKYPQKKFTITGFPNGLTPISTDKEWKQWFRHSFEHIIIDQSYIGSRDKTRVIARLITAWVYDYEHSEQIFVIIKTPHKRKIIVTLNEHY